jgi:large subunit ribosomal protein L24
MAVKIKKGDIVVVMRGREKGKTGEVIKVLRDRNRVVVKNVNFG